MSDHEVQRIDLLAPWPGTASGDPLVPGTAVMIGTETWIVQSVAEDGQSMILEAAFVRAPSSDQLRVALDELGQ